MKNIIYSTEFNGQKIHVQGVSIEYDYLPCSLNNEELQIDARHGVVTGVEIVESTGKNVDYDEPVVIISVRIYVDGEYVFAGELAARCELETQYERLGYKTAFGFDSDSGRAELTNYLHNQIWSASHTETGDIMAYIKQAYDLESEISEAIEEMNALLVSYLEGIKIKA